MADLTREIHGVSSRPVDNGGFSDIYTGIWTDHHGELKVAIKVVRAAPNDPGIQRIRRRLEKEMRVWKDLYHHNVQELSGLYNGIGSLPALVSPWCNSGNIQSFVRERASDPNIDPDELDRIKLNLLIGVMSGVQFLHIHDIIHGDIKGANILISDLGDPLVCDFGLSRVIDELSESSTQAPRGTWRWMAPELHLDEHARLSFGSDIWACGCLFIEVWSTILPYHSKNQRQFILALNAGEGPCPNRPADMPVFIWVAVQECCKFDATRRPRASHVKANLKVVRLPSQTAVPLSPIKLERATFSVAWFPDSNHIAVGLAGGDVYVLNRATRTTDLHLFGHTDDTNQVAVSPNGRLLASCSNDNSIRLWDAHTGLEVGLSMGGHDGWICSVAFSPDGRHLVSGSHDHTIRVWSSETCTTVFSPFRGHTNTVLSVSYSPDGSHIVSGSSDKTIRVWDARMGQPVRILRNHTDIVRSVAYSPDGLRIVSGSDDHTVRIWDATTGQQVGRSLRGHSAFVRSVAYSPDGTRIVSGSIGSDANVMRLWDASTGAFIDTLRGHRDTVLSVAFSPDGQWLASASWDRTVRIWEATDEWRGAGF